MTWSLPLLLLLLLLKTVSGNPMDGKLSRLKQPERSGKPTRLADGFGITTTVYESSTITTDVTGKSEVTLKMFEATTNAPKKSEVTSAKDAKVATDGSNLSEYITNRTPSGDAKVATDGSNPSESITTITPSGDAKVATDGSNPSEGITTRTPSGDAKEATDGSNPSEGITTITPSGDAKVATDGSNPSEGITTITPSGDAKVATDGSNPSENITTITPSGDAKVATDGSNPSENITTITPSGDAKVATDGSNNSEGITTRTPSGDAKVATDGSNPSEGITTRTPSGDAKEATDGSNPSEGITTRTPSGDAKVATDGSNPSENITTITPSGDAKVATDGFNPSEGITTRTPSGDAKVATDGSNNSGVTTAWNSETSPDDAKSFEESVNDKLDAILDELDGVNDRRIVCNISIGIGEEQYKAEKVRRQLAGDVHVQLAAGGVQTQQIVVQVAAQQFTTCLTAALQGTPGDTPAAHIACLTQALLMYDPDSNEETLTRDQEVLSSLGQGVEVGRREAVIQHVSIPGVERHTLPGLTHEAGPRDDKEGETEAGQGAQTRPSPGTAATLRIRKEYRALTKDERRRFHAAMEKVFKNGTVANFGRVHSQTSLTAHRGAAFLPWHRVFITKFEDALREFDATVTLPYWDCTLDSALHDPSRSMLWTDQLLGNVAGNVVTGLAAGWMSARHPLHRQAGAASRLPGKQDFQTLMTKCHLQDVSYPGGGAATFEQLHNDVHAWVGGDMSAVGTAAYDPAFYLMHAFFDYKWQQFRHHQAAQCGVDPATDYPGRRDSNQGRHGDVDVDGMKKRSVHGGDDVMDGMPDFTNRDGISDTWTTHVFTYAPSPSCADNCAHSELLYCHTTHHTCVARPRPETRPETRPAPRHNASHHDSHHDSHHHVQTRPQRKQPRNHVSEDQLQKIIRRRSVDLALVGRSDLYPVSPRYRKTRGT